MSLHLDEQQSYKITSDMQFIIGDAPMSVYAIRHNPDVLMKKHIGQIIGTGYKNQGSLVGDSGEVWYIISTKKHLNEYDSDWVQEIKNIHKGVPQVAPDYSKVSDSAPIKPTLQEFLSMEFQIYMKDSVRSGMFEEWLSYFGDSGLSQHSQLTQAYAENNSLGSYILGGQGDFVAVDASTLQLDDNGVVISELDDMDMPLYYGKPMPAILLEDYIAPYEKEEVIVTYDSNPGVAPSVDSAPGDSADSA